MKLRQIAHDAPEMEAYKESIASEVRFAQQLGMSYWLFVAGEHPVGLVMVGKEPVRFFAPIGTPLALFTVLDYKQSQTILNEFAAAAVNLAFEHTVDYATITVPSDQKQLIDQFRTKAFEELEDSYRMTRPLNEAFSVSDELRFEQVQRSEVNDFLEVVKECMSGSPDVVLNIVLEQLKEIPEQLLDIWYQQELLYFVYKKDQRIGILDLTPSQGVVNNIGVSPQHRGKGYGRQMLLFGLQKLRAHKQEKASLRVAVNNEVAVQLYQRLGFQIEEQRLSLIWRKPANS